MNIGNLFLSFDGRIGRLQFWIGIIVIELLALSIQWGLGVPLAGDPADVRGRVLALVIGSISLYPTLAVSVKRLHDRNQGGTVAWLLAAALAIALIGDFFGYFNNMDNTGLLHWIVFAGIALIVFGFLIELGFRRGTPGLNAYGPDPTDGKA
jgi:uncharacterized membrane protein YhaH (DUF805 family)